MATSEDIKAAAIRLLAKGVLTKSEVARFAGVSRQMVGKWAQDVPYHRARDAYAARVWRQATGRKR